MDIINTTLSTQSKVALDELPPVQSVEFAFLASLALVTPYLFIGITVNGLCI